MKTLFQKIFVLIFAGLFVAGCAPQRPVDVAPALPVADGSAYGAPTQPPPENQKEIKSPPPGSAALWWYVPGRWDWRGKWVWVQGFWRQRPHPGDYWVEGKWEKQGDIYVWKSGHWNSDANFGA